VYEFSESQNQLIRDLAHKMQIVGYFLTAIGFLVIVSGVILTVQQLSLAVGQMSQSQGVSKETWGSLLGGLGNLVQGSVQCIVGWWTARAAKSFRLIVWTRGNDIENLMGALGELRKLYGLQYWLIMMALILVSVALVVGLILSLGSR